jgi:hypothetical protein
MVTWNNSSHDHDALDALLVSTRCQTFSVWLITERYQRTKTPIVHVRWVLIGRSQRLASTPLCYLPPRHADITRPVASVRWHPDVRLMHWCATTSHARHATTDRTLSQRSVLSTWASGQCFSARNTTATSPIFSTLAQMCQPPCISPCACLLAYFHKHF